MARQLTPEERSEFPLCGAMTKRGVPCRAFAGQGTDHTGMGTCKFHGGSTPNHKKRASAIQIKKDMVTLGVGLDLDPAEALLLLNSMTSGHVAWLGERIKQLTDEELGQPHGEAIVSLYSEERDRLSRIAKACVDAGVRQEQIKATKRYGEQIVLMLNGLRGDLSLTKEQERQWDGLVQKWWALSAKPESADARAAVKPKVRELTAQEETGQRRFREACELGYGHADVGRMFRHAAEGTTSGQAAARAMERARTDFLREQGMTDLDSDRWERFVEAERAVRATKPLSGEVVE